MTQDDNSVVTVDTSEVGAVNALTFIKHIRAFGLDSLDLESDNHSKISYVIASKKPVTKLHEARELIEQNPANYSYQVGQLLAFVALYGIEDIDISHVFFDGETFLMGPAFSSFTESYSELSFNFYSPDRKKILSEILRGFVGFYDPSSLDLDKLIEGFTRLGETAKAVSDSETATYIDKWFFEDLRLLQVRGIFDVDEDTLFKVWEYFVKTKFVFSQYNEVHIRELNDVIALMKHDYPSNLNLIRNSDDSSLFFYEAGYLVAEEDPLLNNLGKRTFANLLLAVYETYHLVHPVGVPRLESYETVNVRNIGFNEDGTAYVIELQDSDMSEQIIFSISQTDIESSNSFYRLSFYDSFEDLEHDQKSQLRPDMALKLNTRPDKITNEQGKSSAEIEHRVSQLVYGIGRSQKLTAPGYKRKLYDGLVSSSRVSLLSSECNINVFNWLEKASGDFLCSGFGSFNNPLGFFADIHSRGEEVLEAEDCTGQRYLFDPNGNCVLDRINYVERFQNLSPFFSGNRLMEIYSGVIKNIIHTREFVLNLGTYDEDIFDFIDPITGEVIVLPSDCERANISHQAEAIFNLYDDLRTQRRLYFDYPVELELSAIMGQFGEHSRKQTILTNRAMIDTFYFNYLHNNSFVSATEFWFEYDLLAIGLHLETANNVFGKLRKIAKAKDTPVLSHSGFYEVKMVHHYVAARECIDRLKEIESSELSPNSQQYLPTIQKLDQLFDEEFIPPEFLHERSAKIYKELREHGCLQLLKEH